jgi:glycosyltransferase 2 family protein
MQLRMSDKRLWVGTGISLFFLFLLFRKIDCGQLVAAFREVDFRYLIVAVLATFASFFFRAVRWKYLLIPLKKCPTATVFSATIIGLMANGLFPARLGELARTYVLAEREKLGKSSVLASVVIDRMADVISLLVLLISTLFFLDLPSGSVKDRQILVVGGCTTLLISLMVIIFLVLLKVGKVNSPAAASRIFERLFPKLTEKVSRVVDSFVHGINLPTKFGHSLAIIGASVAAWVFSIIPVDLVLRSFGISLPIFASMFILVMLAFAVMVPATPGFIGTYHYACFTALGVFNVPQGKALSVALVMHAVGFVPVVIAGFVCLWRTGLSLKELSDRDEI